jgi:probable phosphoglycerate mutase
MIRVVYLARHGETEWNRVGRWQGQTDVPLNDDGRQQARALAEKLRATPLSGIVASDLSRARETAEIVAGVLGVPLTATYPELRERCFGLFEGLTRDECAAQHADHWRRWTEDPRALPPGAESFEDLSARMIAAVTRIASAVARPDAPVLVVGHGAAIRSVLAHARGAPVAPIANAALHRVELHGSRLLASE